MSINQFIIIGAMIIVGAIFFLVAQNFIFGWTGSTQESMYKAQAEEIVSIIQRAASEQGQYFYYCLDISLSNISIKNGILTYQKDNSKFLFPIPKEINETELIQTASVCVLKENDSLSLSGEKPKCNLDSMCTIDECKENCPDCYGPDDICKGDGLCNKNIGESCLNSADCSCQAGVCCPSSFNSDEKGCSNTANISRSSECWCTSQCEGGLNCNPTYPTFTGYQNACCEPTKGWNGTECVALQCPTSNLCPGAPTTGGEGDGAWTDANGNLCCPLTDSGISGPVCSNKHCCPTSKPKWCDRPSTGSARCMDQTEYQNEGCKPTLDCNSINSLSDLPSSWDWRNVNGQNWMPPIRDQGQCGSCWAFSAIGAVEGTYNIEQSTPGANTDLSEQDLVSCSGAGSCAKGGWPSDALRYIRSSGACDENCFPYREADVSCQRCSDVSSRLWKIASYTHESNMFEIKKAIACKGPLSITVMPWPGYGAGHAIVAVGWNDNAQSCNVGNSGNGCWIIRNSWGLGWGDRGYGTLGYGTNGAEENDYSVTDVKSP